MNAEKAEDKDVSSLQGLLGEEAAETFAAAMSAAEDAYVSAAGQQGTDFLEEAKARIEGALFPHEDSPEYREARAVASRRAVEYLVATHACLAAHMACQVGMGLADYLRLVGKAYEHENILESQRRMDHVVDALQGALFAAEREDKVAEGSPLS